jgi:hypothetical protein
MRLALSALLLACTGCSMMEPPPEIVRTPSIDWRNIATQSDRARLREWRSTFTAALAAARAGGHAADIAREGALLEPDAALGGTIPEGLYRCRVIKLGANSPRMLNYVAYPSFSCRIQLDGRLRTFFKLSGSQRQAGTIFPGDTMREVFLGTLMLGDEPRAMQYGVDEERDVAGFVERIGPDRWRLVMPSPHFESQLDVMELVPSS